MKVNGSDYRTIWMEPDGTVKMIHQNELPFRFRIFNSTDYSTTISAIRDMIVRGAGAIGVAAGFAMAQAFLQAEKEKKCADFILQAKAGIEHSRPTARNLFYATQKVFEAGLAGGADAAVFQAQQLAEEDMIMSAAIGQFGNELIRNNFKILTHCNAGRLAFVDHGSALAPIYEAHRSGKHVFVFVDETRPRSQGARLTAWELLQERIPFDIISDNAAGHFMKEGEIDIVITGADRIARNGDTANKIGTLEKAICAKYFGIPFYIAAPTPTFDLNCSSGIDIPIEERNTDEVLWQTGQTRHGNLNAVMVAAPGSTARNPAFDVTPAELITGIITEIGVIKPTGENITKLLNPS
jgi:methylthioribose-1-phosphate isomerase